MRMTKIHDGVVTEIDLMQSAERRVQNDGTNSACGICAIILHFAL